MKRLLSAIACASLVLVLAGFALAQAKPAVVSNVKVVSDKVDDVTTLEDWKAAFIKDGMSDQDKAIAILKTVTKYRHQDNPPGEGLEGSPAKGNGNVHDPMKTIHVYGYGMCCCAAADIEGLARYIGMPARGRIINAHSVPEVWYDGAWHLLDSSLMFYLIKPDGKLASVDEMKADIAKWRKAHPEIKNDGDLKNFAKNEGWKQGPPLFATCTFYDKDGINRAGWHGWWSNIGEYNWKQASPNKIVVPPDTVPTYNVYDYGATMGYQVNVQLREGEKLTRNWSNKGLVTSGINMKNKKNNLTVNRGALGLQAEMGDLAPGRVGNGILEYDAMADSQLAADALKFENLKLEGGKIRVVDAAKPATLIVRMATSYIYLTGEMTSKSVVGDGGSITVSTSVNNGLDWKELVKFDKSGDQKTDLKPVAFNRYDYRVKFDFAGAGSGLDALKFVHDVQHSQAPLPIITAGANKITFTAGAQEGTISIQGNMEGEGEALWIGNFHPTVDGCEVKRFAVGGTGRGSAIVPVTTPGDITRVRLGVHWRARDPKDGYNVVASFDGGKTWKDVCKLDQANPAKSTYVVFKDIPAGVREAQLKFEGTQRNTTCIFDLRVDVDYKEPAGGFRPVKVTYVWTEGGKEKTDAHVCQSPKDTWTITCGEGTVANSYTVELVQ